jgi:hypothetical protein
MQLMIAFQNMWKFEDKADLQTCLHFLWINHSGQPYVKLNFAKLNRTFQSFKGIR